MEEQHFYECLRETVAQRLGRDYEVSRKQVTKNNGVRLEALLIRRPGMSVVPTIYTHEYYEGFQRGVTLSDLAEHVEDVYRNSCDWSGDDVSFDFEDVKDNIYYRIISLRRNEENLIGVPHLSIGEYAVVYQCMVYSEGVPMGNIRIREEHIARWGTTVEEVKRLAIQNTMRILPPTIRPIDEVLQEILMRSLAELKEAGGEEAEERNLQEMIEAQKERKLPMYVLSNKYNSEGATSILYGNYMDEFQKQLNQDFYILPSSIHEVILIPKEQAPEYEEMRSMVYDINRTQVPEQEFLSDEVQLYSDFRKQLPGVFCMGAPMAFGGA